MSPGSRHNTGFPSPGATLVFGVALLPTPLPAVGFTSRTRAVVETANAFHDAYMQCSLRLITPETRARVVAAVEDSERHRQTHRFHPPASPAPVLRETWWRILPSDRHTRPK